MVDPDILRNLQILREKVQKTRQSQYSISKTLFIARNEADLSVQDIKDRTGWSGQKVSDFEKQANSDFDPKELQVYCKAVGIKMDSKLLGDDFMI